MSNRIKSARPGAVAFYSSNINDMLAAVVTPFLQALGAQPPVFYDTENAYAGRGTVTKLVDQYFGQAGRRLDPLLPPLVRATSSSRSADR